MNKKLLVILVACVFTLLTVGIASAAEWDNVKSYNEETRTATIKNTFGLPLIGGNIAKVKLLSDSKVVTPPGYFQFADLNITPYTDYSNFINEIGMFDRKDNMKELNDKIDVMYWGDIVVDDYISRCISSTHKNDTKYDTNCFNEKVGEHVEKGWKPFNKKILKENEVVRIGLFGTIKHGESKEWIPTFAGVEVDEWAVWEGNLKAGLVGCWTMDETSGTVIDFGPAQRNNGTNVGGTAGVPSQIASLGSAYKLGEGSNIINISDSASLNFTSNFSIGMVVNGTSTNTGLMGKGLSAGTGYFLHGLSTTGVFWFVDQSDGTGTVAQSPTHDMSTGNTNLLIGTYYAGVQVEVFVNGTSKNIGTGNIEAAALADPSPFYIGGRVGNIYADVMYVSEAWVLNYTITTTDAAFIWNSGNIISCNAQPPTPFITLEAPANDTTILVPTANLSCTAFDDGGITNVSLQWDGTPEQTNTSGFNNTIYNFTKTMAVGLHEWACEAWDDEDAVNNTVPVFHITYVNDLVIALNAPVNEFNSTSQTLYFNGTPADDTAVVNVSFILNGIYNETNSSVFNNTLVNFQKNFAPAKYNWTMEVCDAVSCVNATARNFTYALFFETSQTFNASAFETENETFIINVTTNGTAPTSANLFYDETEYAATITNTAGNNYNISRSIDIPLTAETKNWNFNVTINGVIVNSTAQTQIINTSTFVHCGVVPTYLNLTFKNETVAEEFVTAEVDTDWNFWLGGGTTFKTLAFTNTTENANYSFCFTSNVNKSLTANVSMTYDNSISEQRNFEKEFALTNATTNQTLFLLPTTEGVFVTFQTTNIAEQIITGVSANVTLTGDLIASGITDDAGLIQYFLDPDTTYVFNFFKTGFTLVSTTLKPTQSAYTIIMGSPLTPIQNDTTKGISYTILPTVSYLSNGTNTEFNLSFSSEFWDLELYGFAMKNSTGDVFNVTSDTTSTGGDLGVVLDTADNTDLIMEIFWTIEGNQTNVTRVWAVLDTSDEGFSIKNFFDDLSTYLTSGLFGMNSFALGLVIFIIIILTTGIISSKFGITDATGLSMIVFALVLFFDVGLGIFPNPINAVPNFPSIFIGLIFASTLIKRAITR